LQLEALYNDGFSSFIELEWHLITKVPSWNKIGLSLFGIHRGEFLKFLSCKQIIIEEEKSLDYGNIAISTRELTIIESL
tara:strand:- start:233 stop:469 length:237 start_codon:yes stop_codon:yes gene_type:complete